MIAVIDYKAGNITSVLKALAAVGAAAEITSDPAVVGRADKVILPGVGHFAATRMLQESGLAAAVGGVVGRGVPFLGICVGLQWLHQGSAESAEVPGLGLLPGVCARFPHMVKVPHVGWNSLEIAGSPRILAGIDSGTYVYYTHSYWAPVADNTVAVTNYGGAFAAAVERGNVFGVQFHPEKSGAAGLRVLRNFVEMERAC